MFLSNFLIALREGVEASLLVGILVAFLVKTNRKDVLPKLWIGVIVAAVVPLSLGAYMTWGPYTLTFQAQEAIGGILSIIAAAFITWMIFWMANHGAEMSKKLTTEADRALSSGKTWVLVWLAITAVGREGIETALFVWATVKSTASTSVLQPTLGMISGLIVAIFIGYLIYSGGTRFDLKKFFLITGLALIIVAAGVISYGIGDLQEAALIPGWGHPLYDFSSYFDGHISTYLSTSSWWFTLLEAMFQLNLAPTALQFTSWLLYILIVATLYLRIQLKSSHQSTAIAGEPQNTK